MRLPGGAAPDREPLVHLLVEQAFAQDALPDHAGPTEQNHFQASLRSLLSSRLMLFRTPPGPSLPVADIAEVDIMPGDDAPAGPPGGSSLAGSRAPHSHGARGG